MRRLLMTAAVLALAAAPAFAADDVMAGFYGNTAVVTGGMVESHTHYRADHTFDVTASAMGMDYKFNGTWAIDGSGQLCRTYVGSAPPGSPNPLCTPIAPHKVGDSWTVTMAGNTRTVTLKPGVQ